MGEFKFTTKAKSLSTTIAINFHASVILAIAVLFALAQQTAQIEGCLTYENKGTFSSISDLRIRPDGTFQTLDFFGKLRYYPPDSPTPTYERDILNSFPGFDYIFDSVFISETQIMVFAIQAAYIYDTVTKLSSKVTDLAYPTSWTRSVSLKLPGFPIVVTKAFLKETRFFFYERPGNYYYYPFFGSYF